MIIIGMRVDGKEMGRGGNMWWVVKGWGLDGMRVCFERREWILVEVC